MKESDNGLNTPCKRLAEALHAACVALDQARAEREEAGSIDAASIQMETAGAPWTEKVGHHVALAISAMPDSALRAWLLTPNVAGGEEIYRTLKIGAGVRANGKAVAA